LRPSLRPSLCPSLAHLQDPRTEDAPLRAGLTVLERWDYAFVSGRAPHIATLVCAKLPPGPAPAPPAANGGANGAAGGAAGCAASPPPATAAAAAAATAMGGGERQQAHRAGGMSGSVRGMLGGAAHSAQGTAAGTAARTAARVSGCMVIRDRATNAFTAEHQAFKDLQVKGGPAMAVEAPLLLRHEPS